MMNILARILSHGFAIAVVLILAVGYIYRGELFPGMELPAFLYPGTPAPTEVEAPAGDIGRDEPAAELAQAEVTGEPAREQAEDTTRQQPLVSGEQGPADTGTMPEAAAPVEPPAEIPGAEPEVMAVPGEPPADIAGEEPQAMAAVPEESPAEITAEIPDATVAASESEVPAVASVEPLQPESPAPAQDLPVEQEATAGVTAPVTPAEPAPAEDAQPVEDVQEAAGEADGSGTVDVTDMPTPAADITATTPPAVDSSAQPGATDKPYQLLAMAREAFWMHNYAEAETHYRDLIALEPDNPDGYGELGNMYFTRGNWEQAATAYFNAGKRLIQTGRTEQAEVLVKVIRGLNGNQADELEAMLSAAGDTDKSQ